MRDVPTRALSILQPWAHAIVHLGKRIENRDWRGCPHRCEILIHASKGVGTIDAFDASVTYIGEASVDSEETGLRLANFHGDFLEMDRRSRWRPRAETPLGGIVGRARIDGVIAGEADFAAYAANVPDGEKQRVWWTGGFALVLADVEPLPFIPCKGALGLWTVTPEIRAQIARGA